MNVYSALQSITIFYCYEHLLDLDTSKRGHQRYKYNQPKQIDIGRNDIEVAGDDSCIIDNYHGNRSKNKVIEIVKNT